MPLTWMPRMVAASWLGVLLIAIAYAMGRYSQTLNSVPLLWIGQILLFVPIVFRLLQRDCSAREAFFGATALVIGSYLVKVCYSPVGFRFPDELQHYRTLVDILETGSFFGRRNPALPISPSYPGLELVTSSVMQLTSLPLFPGALIVVAVCHLSLGWALFQLVRSIGGSARVAGLAVVAYATQPHYQHFDAMFIYQALGVAFSALSLWSLVKSSDPANGRPRLWLTLAAVFAVAAVPTHHISTYMMLGLLSLAFLIQLMLRQGQVARQTLIVLTCIGLATGAWIMLVGTRTATYFEPAAQQLADSVWGLLNKSDAKNAPPPQVGSYLDKYLAYASVGLTAVSVGWGALQLRRTARTRPWTIVMVLASLTYFLAVVIRLVASDGAELYGRAVSFIFIPVSFIVAVAARQLMSRYRAGLMVATVGLSLIFLGGLSQGWPPAWQRVPTGYLPGGYESSIDEQGIDAGRWVGSHMPPYGWYWATDLFNMNLVATYGKQIPTRTVSELFNSPEWTQADRQFIHNREIRFILSDLRLTRDLPAAGSYFPSDPRAFRYTKPMTAGQLRKFDTIPSASRMYDNGSIAIYDVQEASRADK